MKEKFRPAFVAALIVLALWVGSLAQATDVTFFVTSDLHFTSKSLPSKVKVGIQAMNSYVPQTPYPAEIGGSVSDPYAVITCGDLCDGGAGTGATDTPKWYSSRNYQDQWAGFDYYFPRDGVSRDRNRLRYRNYATAGNHDFYNNFGQILSSKSWYVANKLQGRYGLSCNLTNGNVYYSVDIDGVHVVSLGRWTDGYVLGWLAGDLASIAPGAPIVLFLHYAFDDGQLWYTDAERQQLADAIAGYNVIAILHGHTHQTGHYNWNGYDCYDDGSTGQYSELGVLHITDNTVSYCQYQAVTDRKGNCKGGYWKWWHSKTY